MGFWEGFLILIVILGIFQWLYNWQKIKMASLGMEEAIITMDGESWTVWVKSKEVEQK